MGDNERRQGARWHSQGASTSASTWSSKTSLNSMSLIIEHVYYQGFGFFADLC
jgi:hypothetical protein